MTYPDQPRQPRLGLVQLGLSAIDEGFAQFIQATRIGKLPAKVAHHGLKHVYRGLALRGPGGAAAAPIPGYRRAKRVGGNEVEHALLDDRKAHDQVVQSAVVGHLGSPVSVWAGYGAHVRRCVHG